MGKLSVLGTLWKNSVFYILYGKTQCFRYSIGTLHVLRYSVGTLRVLRYSEYALCVLRNSVATLQVLRYSVGTLCVLRYSVSIPGILSDVSILLCYFCTTTAFGGDLFLLLFCFVLSQPVLFYCVGMPSLTMLQDCMALKSRSHRSYSFLCFPWHE